MLVELDYDTIENLIHIEVLLFIIIIFSETTIKPMILGIITMIEVFYSSYLLSFFNRILSNYCIFMFKGKLHLLRLKMFGRLGNLEPLDKVMSFL